MHLVHGCGAWKRAVIMPWKRTLSCAGEKKAIEIWGWRLQNCIELKTDYPFTEQLYPNFLIWVFAKAKRKKKNSLINLCQTISP